MARLDWAVVCDLAFFDRHERLCLIGLVTTFPVPALPLALNQVMMVAKVADRASMDDESGVTISIRSPTGVLVTLPDPEQLIVEVSAEYVLVTLREVPLLHEGMYAFQMAIGNQPPVVVDVSVLALRGTSSGAEVH